MKKDRDCKKCLCSKCKNRGKKDEWCIECKVCQDDSGMVVDCFDFEEN
jgi:hypothetical protein